MKKPDGNILETAVWGVGMGDSGGGQFILPGNRTGLRCQRGPLGVGSWETLIFTPAS